jgi:hypothetical protein
MAIENEVKQVLEASGVLTLVTVGTDGLPHPIVAGSGKVVGGTVVFEIHGMKATCQNLAKNSAAWVLGATLKDKPQGYRLTGTAAAKDKQLIFTPAKIESLI